MIDARRMLRKSEDKFNQAVRVLHCYAKGINQAPGPNHGVVIKAATTGIKVSLRQDGEIWIETPFGRLCPSGHGMSRIIKHASEKHADMLPSSTLVTETRSLARNQAERTWRGSNLMLTYMPHLQ